MRANGVETDMDRYKDKNTGLMREFQQQFQVFCELETKFTVFRSLFTVKASDLPVDRLGPLNFVNRLFLS